MDTIVAIASPPGPGERGVIRLSGPRAAKLVAACVRANGAVPPPHRGLVHGRLHDGRGTQPVLLLWMPGPRSYTREDVAELHLSGAPPLLAAALERLLALGARAARPGEFTRLAFESGRIDLLRAEGVLELVTAGGNEEARAAAVLLGGGLSDRVGALREELLELLALSEASLDFDEADTGHVEHAELAARAVAIDDALAEALSFEERRTPVSGRPRVVLLGAPNAGKSTLFRALVPGRAVLVSAHPGATRDGVSGALRLAGVECELLDAPGIDPVAEGPDRAAQGLAERERAGADLVLWVADAARATGESLAEEARALPPGAAVVLVWNQVDRPEAAPAPPSGGIGPGALVPAIVSVSARTGAGLDALVAAAARALGLSGAGADPGTAEESARATGSGAGRELAARHREALARARAELDAARERLATGVSLDLVGEGLRTSLACLDEIAGRSTPEDVLDALFARFCIGK